MGMAWLAWGLMAALSGQPFPAMAGQSLAAKPLSLPGAFHGKPGLAILGFSIGAREDCKAWALWASSSLAAHPGLEVYMGVVVEATPRVAPLVDAILRSGADARVADRGFTTYDPDQRLRQALGLRQDRSAVVLLADRQGKVAWAHEGGHHPAAVAALEAKAKALRLW